MSDLTVDSAEIRAGVEFMHPFRSEGSYPYRQESPQIVANGSKRLGTPARLECCCHPTGSASTLTPRSPGSMLRDSRIY